MNDVNEATGNGQRHFKCYQALDRVGRPDRMTPNDERQLDYMV